MNVDVWGVTFSYGGAPSLTGVSMALRAGEMLGVVGPNGSGKTTLLKCLNRILEPKQGRVLLDGRDIRSMSRLDVAKDVGYVPQGSTGGPDRLPVFEVVLMGRRPRIRWQAGEGDKEKAWAVLRLLNIERLALRDFGEISGGEQQKVLIARSLAQEARVLLLDEPTSHLDIRHQLEVMGLARRLVSEDGLAAAVALHDLNLASGYCDKILMMKDGRVHAAGDAAAVLSADNIRDVYGIEAEIGYHRQRLHIIPIAPVR